MRRTQIIDFFMLVYDFAMGAWYFWRAVVSLHGATEGCKLWVFPLFDYWDFVLGAGCGRCCLNFCDPGSNMISWCRARWERSGLNAFLTSSCKNVGRFQDCCFRVNWKFLGRFLVLRV